jgi:DNA-binding beta-propeller fold protein YncE
MRRFFSVALLSLGLGGGVWSQSLRKVGTIDLPGPKGQRFDYLTTDDEDHYLLSAHLGPGILYVIDMGTDKLVKAIPGVPGITGLEYVPGLRKIYTSNWGENKIGVVDLRSMSVVKRLTTAAKPNGSVYAAPFRKVYVSDTDGLAVAVVDVDKDGNYQDAAFQQRDGNAAVRFRRKEGLRQSPAPQ